MFSTFKLLDYTSTNRTDLGSGGGGLSLAFFGQHVSYAHYNPHAKYAAVFYYL